MSFNIGKTIAGPALIKYRGVTYYTAGKITLTPEIETFDIPVEPMGKQAFRRTKNRVLKVSFTPSGRIVEALGIYGRFANPDFGSLLSPERLTVSAVETTDNELTTQAHNIVDAEDAMGNGPDLPAPLTDSTLYGVKRVSATEFTVHSSLAGAIAGTGVVDLSDAGTAPRYIDVARSLVIHTFSGEHYRIHNFGLSKIPDLTFSATKSMIGPIEGTAYPRLGTAPGASGAGLFYTQTAVANADATFPDSDLPTVVPITTLTGDPGSLGTIYFNQGITISVNANLDPVEIDGLGVAAHRISDVNLTMKGIPFGLTTAQLSQLVALEDAIGADNAGFDVSIDLGGLLTFAAAGMRARSTQANFSSEQQRAGEIELFGQRASAATPVYTFTEAA